MQLVGRLRRFGGFCLAGALLCPLLLAPLARAQSYSPEVLRTNPAGLPLPANPPVVAVFPNQTTLAPMPNADIRAPIPPQKGIGWGAVLTRPTTGYRGETFNSDSTTDPGVRESHIPISGLSLKVPLN